jgi:anti-anti-sigma regulatory factor
MTSIKIKKNHLFFRNDARLISKQIKESADKFIILDFSGVNFVSRSFTDELLNILEKFNQQQKVIKIINLKPAWQKFFQQVKRTKSEIRKKLSAVS